MKITNQISDIKTFSHHYFATGKFMEQFMPEQTNSAEVRK